MLGPVTAPESPPDRAGALMNIPQQQLLDSMEGIAYLTDANSVILAVGRPRWNAFARDNGGEALTDGRGVIGYSIFDAVAGDRVRAGYEKLFLAILQHRCRSARLLSRCDSPGVRRHLVITMAPVFVRGAIRRMLFQSIAVAELVRPPMDVFDFRAMGERARRDPALPVLGMCSTCQSVRWPSRPASRASTASSLRSRDATRARPVVRTG